MITILDSVLSFLLLYKYVALFLVSYLAALVAPLPSSAVLAASGAFAAQGYFSLTWVLVVAFLGNFFGDLTGYVLARLYGVEILQKIGFRRILASRLYESVILYLREFSYSLIFFSRFLTTVGPLVNILAGLGKMKYKTFFMIEIAGEIAYVLLYGLVGYFLGSEWEQNIEFLFEATFVIVSLGIMLMLIEYRLFKRMRRLSRR
ncbi:MAG: DedA family protein [Candidatus Paceibacterota bacterium]